jgi:hypothetical protein
MREFGLGQLLYWWNGYVISYLRRDRWLVTTFHWTVEDALQLPTATTGALSALERQA